ncbi:ubiquitin-like activating enzyme 3 [Dermatophagoides farinae]|uniref:NEDD8-activating enzyme E1 catalytic subunit n=1 Tax=Dermatophagoides farinae TaxID=6954 RepID=A0A922I3X0_DERFA|nr:NEDD8-activating enzyme E1 catalytic subunit-like [Dermatophagoides farinae]KAH7639553.1 nedd8-activating enzyme e1 catalytic subunit-like protein [Dermatophagoides farinae]KAH9521749.1 NEDD8-activating protein uba3 [Dermatophagoides farinae]
METDSVSSSTRRQWNHLNKVLSRTGPFVQAGFDVTAGLTVLQEAKILVVGAGGLGCEMLKDLAMMGFVDIHVIDCDTIEISNLNRQFLFRTKDVGRSKAVVAAEFINKRVAGCNVTAHFCKIEDKDPEFYYQFNVIVSGLDAIGPRRWLNTMLFGLLQPSSEMNPAEMINIIPLVDGGTEGFKGNLRVIIPSHADYPCVECMLDLYPPQITYPLCTLTHRPRLPEHCIEYVKLIQWNRDNPFGEVELDGDDPTHLQWVYERAMERATEFGIESVTYRLTQGVVKHIIPAVASTNATIAAACCTEVFKLMTAAAPFLNNYLVLNNSDGIYTYTYAAERKRDCKICGTLPIPLKISSKKLSLNDLIDQLVSDYQMAKENISIRTIMKNGSDQTLYMASLAEQTSLNLTKTLPQLMIDDGQLIVVIDNHLMKKFVINYV